MSEALSLLRREREQHEQKLAALRREIQIGLDQANAGLFSPLTVEDIAAETRAAARAAAPATPRIGMLG